MKTVHGIPLETLILEYEKTVKFMEVLKTHPFVFESMLKSNQEWLDVLKPLIDEAKQD